MVLAKAKHDAAHQHHQRNLPPMTQLSQPSDLESQPLSSILTHQPTIHHLTLPNLNLSVNVAHRDSYTAPPTARLHPAGTKLVQPSSRPDLEDVTELSEPPTAVSSVNALTKGLSGVGKFTGEREGVQGSIGGAWAACTRREETAVGRRGVRSETIVLYYNE